MKPWPEILVFKDTYRLARRFQVYDGGKRVIDCASSAWQSQSPLQVFCRIVEVVAARLEAPRRAAAIMNACAELRALQVGRDV